MKACEEALTEEFLKANLPVKVESGFWVHIDQVEYSGWVNRNAQFALFNRHYRWDVGSRFFP
ncbi:MAG: hypothetical protein HC902_04395 [Calothrix sp. SM1_5_4]|nr:hypothetical protein [Calothrix sp. SM1_5_4]